MEHVIITLDFYDLSDEQSTWVGIWNLTTCVTILFINYQLRISLSSFRENGLSMPDRVKLA